MKYFFTSIISIIIMGITLQAQDKPAYLLFNKKGKTTAYKKLLKASKKADIVLLGNCIIIQ